jgi:hypothetical protein
LILVPFLPVLVGIRPWGPLRKIEHNSCAPSVASGLGNFVQSVLASGNSSKLRLVDGRS